LSALILNNIPTLYMNFWTWNMITYRLSFHKGHNNRLKVDM